MISSYSKKIVQSGNIVEVYHYKNPVLEGFQTDTSKGLKHPKDDDSDSNKDDDRQKALSRARRDLRRLINSNIHLHGTTSKFVTLTFADNIQDIESANYLFKKFKQRLEYNIGQKVLYSAVIEFQKRGAIHYHLVIYNVPYISNKDLRDIWSHGFVKINNISHVNNVGTYVTKYMSKNDDDRLLGKKSYFNSKCLNKPIEYKNEKEVENITSTLNQLSDCLTYENTFENEHQITTYKQYNLNIKKNK